MDNTNYFNELSNNYSNFAGIANRFTKEDRENPMLKNLAKATYSTLRTHFNALRESRTKFDQYNSTLGKQKKAEFLQKIQGDALNGLHTFFEPIKKAADTAAEGYKNARKVPEPENSVAYMRQQEIRTRLSAMSLADRTATIQNQAREGNFTAFEAVMNDPLPAKGFLGATPEEREGLLQDLSAAYAEKKYPEYCQRARETEHLLEQATWLKDTAVCAGLRENEVRAAV